MIAYRGDNMSKMTKQFVFHLPDDLYDCTVAQAESDQTTPTSVLREAIEWYLMDLILNGKRVEATPVPVGTERRPLSIRLGDRIHDILVMLNAESGFSITLIAVTAISCYLPVKRKFEEAYEQRRKEQW
jgi:hypothetical protein